MLPALLALRKTHRTIVESKVYLQAQGVSLENARKRLDVERADLEDQKAIHEELQKRIQSLRAELSAKSESSPGDILRKRKVELEEEGRTLRRDRKKLMVDLGKFIRDHLGSKLALERSGGPIVGDAVETASDENSLARSQEPRKRKRPLNRSRGRRDQAESADESEDGSEDAGAAAAAAAADELRQMVEDLLAAASERSRGIHSRRAEFGGSLVLGSI